jgi:hypothetical protein
MPNPLMINEATRRCLESLSRCFKDGNTARSVEVMKSEVREVAREIAQWQLSGEAKARVFLRPMEDILVNQYGSHNGRRLYWDYFDAFWLQSWSTDTLVPSEAESTVEPAPECRPGAEQGDFPNGQPSAILERA